MCSPFVALNPIFSVKRCPFGGDFAFILILRDEAMHQEDVVYLRVNLAFFTDPGSVTSADPHAVFLCNQNAMNDEKRGVKLNDLY